MSFSSAQLAFIATFPLLTPAAFAVPDEPTQSVSIPNLLLNFRDEICRLSPYSQSRLLQYAKINGFLPKEETDSPTSALEEDSQLFDKYLVGAYTPSTILTYLVAYISVIVETWLTDWQQSKIIPNSARNALETLIPHIPNLKTMETSDDDCCGPYLPIIRRVFLQACLDQNIFDSPGWVTPNEENPNDQYWALCPELSLLTVEEGQTRLLLDCWNDDKLSSHIFPFVCRALEQTKETNITEYLFSLRTPISPNLAQKIFNRYFNPSFDPRFDHVRTKLQSTPTLNTQIANEFISPSFARVPSLGQLIANRCLHPSLDPNYDYAKNRLLNFPDSSHFHCFAAKLQPEQIMPLLSALGAERVKNVFRTMGDVNTTIALFPEQRAGCIQVIGFDHLSSLTKDKDDLLCLLKILPVELIANFIQALGDRFISLFREDRVFDLPLTLAYSSPMSKVASLVHDFRWVLRSLPDDKKIAFFEAMQLKDFDILIPNLYLLIETLKIIPAEQKIRLSKRISSLIDNLNDLVMILGKHFLNDDDSIWKPIFVPIIHKLIPDTHTLYRSIIDLPPFAEEKIGLILIKTSYSVLVKSEKDHQDLISLLPTDKTQLVKSLRQELCTQSGHTMRNVMLANLDLTWKEELPILKNLENLFKMPSNTPPDDIVIFQNILSLIRSYSSSELGKKELEEIIKDFEEQLKIMDSQTPIEHLMKQKNHLLC
jgi:hypothetical protein